MHVPSFPLSLSFHKVLTIQVIVGRVSLLPNFQIVFIDDQGHPSGWRVACSSSSCDSCPHPKRTCTAGHTVSHHVWGKGLTKWSWANTHFKAWWPVWSFRYKNKTDEGILSLLKAFWIGSERKNQAKDVCEPVFLPPGSLSNKLFWYNIKVSLIFLKENLG